MGNLKFSTEELEKISNKYPNTEKNKGEKLKPSRESIESTQRNNEAIERVENSNYQAGTSFIDDMDMMGDGLESMDLDLLEDNSGQPKFNAQAGDWLNLVLASKTSKKNSSPTRMSPPRNSEALKEE